MEKKKKNDTIVLIVVFAIIIFVWLGSWWFINSYFTGSYRGVFGDKFGFINSLFSGLALGGIIWSIRLQHRELGLQRKELSDTREEFKDQNFQTIFFNLHRTQRQIIDEIRIKILWYTPTFESDNKEVLGRKFFITCKLELRKIFESLNHEYIIFDQNVIEEQRSSINPERQDQQEQINEIYRNATLAFTSRNYKIDEDFYAKYKAAGLTEKIRSVYEIFFNRYSYALGHYFRHIYHILLFLEKSEKEKIGRLKLEKGDSKEEKITEIHAEFYDYAQFLKSQMDTPELFTLFYNSFNYPKAKELLVKYRMLDNLRVSDLIKPEHDIIPEFELIK